MKSVTNDVVEKSGRGSIVTLMVVLVVQVPDGCVQICCSSVLCQGKFRDSVAYSVDSL